MANFSNTTNHFLSSLSAEDLQLIQPQLTPIALKQGETLHRQLERISHIYFPLQGVVSLVIDMSEGQSVEAGMIGVNGTVGGGSALNGQFALNRAIVQVEGSAQRIPAELLKQFAEASQSLRHALFQREQVISAHAQQVAACNALHELEARLARWLLQVRDLVQRSKFDLTQEFGSNARRQQDQRDPCSKASAIRRAHQVSAGAHRSFGCRRPGRRGLRVLRNHKPVLSSPYGMGA
jgi:CRP-like cAMP-binding protein